MVTRSSCGGTRAVLEASAQSSQDPGAALAVVVATEGSTYARSGAIALFAGDAGQVGWLSGGCLEPEIERRARQAAAAARLDWFEVDTRDDEALFSGSALGCRGKLRVALLPLRCMPGWSGLVDAWGRAQSPLRIAIGRDGFVHAEVGGEAQRWPIVAMEDGDEGASDYSVAIAAAPTAAIFGAGPETPVLLPALRSLGWIVTLVEHRARWRPMAAYADKSVERPPRAAFAARDEACFDAALVMHHNFELDREALAALASTTIGFIGLLGPARRREDLFRLLPAQARAALAPRLRSPVGLKLGGHGPEAIALSIAAQLHAYRHSP